MAKKIPAFRVSDSALKANRMMNYNEMCDGSTQITPVKIRRTGSFGYHLAEDSKGVVHLIHNDVVMFEKLRERNMGVTETRYMLDGVGKDEIKEFKEAKVEEETVEIHDGPSKEIPEEVLEQELVPKLEKETSSEITEENTETKENENE